jgi:hypothetical protein
MPSQIFEQWRDEQSIANYPFTDAATMRDLSGLDLDKSLIIDAAICVPNVKLPVWLSDMSVMENYVKFTISDSVGRLAFGEWNAAATNQDVVVLKDDANRRVGVLTVDIEAMTRLISNGEVTYGFPATATTFVLGVINIFTTNDSDREILGEILPEQGDVYLIGVDGIVLKSEDGTELVNGVSYPVVRLKVHAVGNPLANRSICGTNFVEPRFVREVVFQKDDQTFTCVPSNVGDILIVAASMSNQASALRINKTAEGISIGLFGNEVKTGVL